MSDLLPTNLGMKLDNITAALRALVVALTSPGSFTGVVQFHPGTAAATAKASGVLYSYPSSFAQIGTTVFTYTLLAGTLAKAGDILRITFAGNAAVAAPTIALQVGTVNAYSVVLGSAERWRFVTEVVLGSASTISRTWTTITTLTAAETTVLQSKSIGCFFMLVEVKVRRPAML